jgi:hypothetical protein
MTTMTLLNTHIALCYRVVHRNLMRPRTNKAGTCLYCGRRLRKAPAPYGAEGYRGDYADNAFCGLRCGYSFGVALAAHGRRLVETTEAQP